MTVKLTTLLTQYLYAHHRLDLPGIGTFLLDASSMEAAENQKQKMLVLSGVSFESNPSVTAAPELIAYISANTGKMKALAASDLESFIELAQQFLNIGKPYTFDGIGTLIKTKSGQYDFVPDTVPAEKLKTQLTKEVKPAEETAGTEKYESFLATPKQSSGIRKPVLILLGICGIGLAVWGGYMLSQRNKQGVSDTKEIATPQQEEATPVKPTDQPVTEKTAPDTLTTTPATPTVAANAGSEYKYILEVADSKRAMKRYNQLRTNLWDVHLETKDSITYKLFMKLPVHYGDTTHILDSLKIWTGRRVYIEHPASE